MVLNIMSDHAFKNIPLMIIIITDLKIMKNRTQIKLQNTKTMCQPGLDLTLYEQSGINQNN
jgi:hypothetical protein